VADLVVAVCVASGAVHTADADHAGGADRWGFVVRCDLAVLVLILVRVLRAAVRREVNAEWIVWFVVLLLAIPIRIVVHPILIAWI
jgi:hypothetical protein